MYTGKLNIKHNYNNINYADYAIYVNQVSQTTHVYLCNLS